MWAPKIRRWFRRVIGMPPIKIDVACDAVRLLINRTMREGDRAAVAMFDEKYAQLIGYSGSLMQIHQGLDKIAGNVNGKGTALFDSLIQSTNFCVNNGRTNASKLTVVLTDGEDTDSLPGSLRRFKDSHDTSNQIVIVIAVGDDVDEDCLRALGTAGCMVVAVENFALLAPCFEALAVRILTQVAGRELRIQTPHQIVVARQLAVQQQAVRMPIDLNLLLDISGSMSEAAW
jgi:Mg-chelatase subunit ChlD